MTVDLAPRPCLGCNRFHDAEHYVCLSCGQTFFCRSQFSTAFTPWAHRRSVGNLVFGSDGSGPWTENAQELVCAPIDERDVPA